MKKEKWQLQQAEKNKLREMVRPLLSWYDKNRRILPWREEPTPYRVWVSEIMLQQTRVEAGKPYFERFLQELPTVYDLAQVSDEKLMKLWEGLGYYNRARNLKKAAQIVVESYHGELPADFEAIKALPGIGPYTAGAISSIAFNLPKPAVDGNVLRVVSRLLASEKDIAKPEVKLAFEEALEETMPRDRAGDFNQSLMEMGAMVCLPNQKAKCLVCPLEKICRAKELGLQEELPRKEKSKPRRIEEKTILLLHDGSRIALQKRPNIGLLAGLWEFPSLKGLAAPDEVLAFVKRMGANIEAMEELKAAQHIFSHVQWNMIGYRITLEKIPHNSPFTWVDIDEIHKKYAIPAAFGKYRDLVKAGK